MFEGVDNAGKSTQIQLLCKRLGARAIFTREPGGCPLGEKLREIMMTCELEPRSELLLMFASRIEHLCAKILPALEEGRLVICDRFIQSTYVYQGYVKGVGAQHIRYLENFAEVPAADLVFFFVHSYKDLSDENRLEMVDQRKVLAGYEACRSSNWIDVPRGLPDEVHEFIYDSLKERSGI